MINMTNMKQMIIIKECKKTMKKMDAKKYALTTLCMESSWSLELALDLSLNILEVLK